MSLKKCLFPLSVIAGEVTSDDGESFRVLQNFGVVGELPSIDELIEIKERAETTIMVINKFFNGDSEEAKRSFTKDYEDRIAAIQSIEEEKPKRKTKVYLMKSGVNNLTKIGKSINPPKRERTLQAEDPRLKMLFHSEFVDDCIEGELHFDFADKRVRGEWFDLSEEDINFIINKLKSLC